MEDDDAVSPGVEAYTAAINAGKNGYRPMEVLALLREMQVKGFKVDKTVYNAAITASRNGGRWKQAVSLLREMGKEKGLSPDISSYNETLQALLLRGKTLPSHQGGRRLPR